MQGRIDYTVLQSKIQDGDDMLTPVIDGFGSYMARLLWALGLLPKLWVSAVASSILPPIIRRVRGKSDSRH